MSGKLNKPSNTFHSSDSENESSIPQVSRKRKAGVSLLATAPKKQKIGRNDTTRLTTTIEKVYDEAGPSRRESVIKYVPKKDIEVIDISDDEEPATHEDTNISGEELPTANNERNQFVNWTLVEESDPIEVEKLRRIEKRAYFQVTHNIHKSSNLLEYQGEIDDSYEAAIRHLIDQHQGCDYFSAKIENESLSTSIYLRPEKIEDFDKTRFSNKVFMVSQSNKDLILNGILDVKVMIAQRMVGSGKTTKAPKTYEQEKINKKSIVVIKNNDNSCGYRALFLGVKYHELNIKDNSRHPQWRVLIQSPRQQELGARQLCYDIRNYVMAKKQLIHENENLNGDDSQAATYQRNITERVHRILIADGTIQPTDEERERSLLDVEFGFNTPMDIEIVQLIQMYFGNRFQIIVINFKTGDQLFVGPESPKQIYLLFSPGGSGHWDLIKEMTSYRNTAYYCIKCNKGYKLPQFHQCKDGCKLCRYHTLCIVDATAQHCDECNKTFANFGCYNRHLENKICKYVKICQLCEASYTKSSKEHVCGELKCKKCSEYYTVQPHYCYLKKLDSEKLIEEDATTKIIVSFDIESMLKPSTEKIIKHKPNLLAAMIVCDACYNPVTKQKSGDYCNICKDGYKLYRGDHCVSSFNEYIFNTLAKIAESNKGQVLVVAHNLSGYDGHWIFKDILDREMRNIEPVMKGTKLMKIDVGNVRFIDSLLFFQQALSSLPKAFDLEDTEKGHFPHYINTPEYQDLECLIGDIPIEMFGKNKMKKDSAGKLQSWYDEMKDKGETFNLERDLEKYCANDVLILLQSIMSFRQLFKAKTGLDPLSRAFTLASVGLEYFRANILEEKTIGITPIDGYGSQRKSSISATAWLDYQQYAVFKKNITREYRTGPYFADGFINESYTDSETGMTYEAIAFEFWGCYYHGHEICGNYDVNKALSTQKKKDYYAKRNIYLVNVYECEFWDKTKFFDGEMLNGRYDEALVEYIFPRIKHLKAIKDNGLHCNPRKALHGGRTNNLKFAYKVRENESILYYDFTSLYPYVLSNRLFPLGHPEVITDEFGDLEQYFGFVSCKVLPPIQLYLPVLPFSIEGKLMFALCRTCAENQVQISCYHRDADRTFTGTFTTCELSKAISLGYEVAEIYEILHYPAQSDGIFREYVRTWLKTKAEE